MFKKKTDGRFRVELKYKNGSEAFMVSNDYPQICRLYEIAKAPICEDYTQSIYEVILFDGDKPLANWTNSAALVKAA
jgi:hypothetical protein